MAHEITLQALWVLGTKLLIVPIVLVYGTALWVSKYRIEFFEAFISPVEFFMEGRNLWVKTLSALYIIWIAYIFGRGLLF